MRFEEVMTAWEVFCAHNLAEPGALIVSGRKCDTANCLQPVSARVLWATGPVGVCASCAKGFTRMGTVLGLPVAVENLTGAGE